MYDDPAPLRLLPTCMMSIYAVAIPSCVQGAEIEVGKIGVRAVLRLVLAGMEEGSDAQAKVLSLGPATVGERRIVGCGGGKVPLLVGSIETSAMARESLSVDSQRRRQHDVPGDNDHSWTFGHSSGCRRLDAVAETVA